MFKKKISRDDKVFAYISGEPGSLNAVICSVSW